jgi:hypothetical protein
MKKMPRRQKGTKMLKADNKKTPMKTTNPVKRNLFKRKKEVNDNFMQNLV